MAAKRMTGSFSHRAWQPGALHRERINDKETVLRSQPTPRRIFLVGCPRSGTTLLQSLLASHPVITSFPESHFFTNVLPGKRRRFLGLVARGAAAYFDALATTVGQAGRARPRLPLIRAYTAAFVDMLDAATLEQRKTVWIEKSPEHLRYIDEIEKRIPTAAFIHIIRSGADVVASLFAAANAPWDGFGRPMSLEECVDRWCVDLEISRRHLTQPNHLLIRYESLVADPKPVLVRACRFIGVEYHENMVADHRTAAGRVILPWESWKAGVLDPIVNANSTKLYDTLGPEQREYVVERTNIEIPAES